VNSSHLRFDHRFVDPRSSSFFSILNILLRKACSCADELKALFIGLSDAMYIEEKRYDNSILLKVFQQTFAGSI
jgi:hypothetical protein